MLGRFVFAVAVGCCTFGCQPSDGLPELHPLTGTIVRGGKPITAGGLIFIPEGGGWGGVVVDANINSDGTFSAQTSKALGTGTVFKPGVKVGRYKVVFHPPGDGSRTATETELKQIVVVQPGANTVALEVSSDPLPRGAGEPRDDANPPEIMTPPTGKR